jgi:hypothetical protein
VASDETSIATDSVTAMAASASTLILMMAFGILGQKTRYFLII